MHNETQTEERQETTCHVFGGDKVSFSLSSDCNSEYFNHTFKNLAKCAIKMYK